MYFAYGSNLVTERLAARVGAVLTVGPARLEGFRLACNKRGRDLSGKANLVADPGAVVWGAVYRLRTEQLERLDGFEGGYRRTVLEVHAADGPLQAQGYVSERLIGDPRPYDWYKRLMLEGARRHGLPAEWIAALEALPERPDLRPAGRVG